MIMIRVDDDDESFIKSLKMKKKFKMIWHAPTKNLKKLWHHKKNYK